MLNYNKKLWLCLIIMLAIIDLIVVIAIKAINAEVASAQINNNIKENLINTEKQEVEAGTSAKVDEIAKKAKNDANSITNELKESAISFIRDNKENFYKDNETMEQAMYYGYLLEYAYENSDTNLAKLGQDVYQAIKYVYRGVETVEDEATQENLRQIEEDLQGLE